ncbi:MAG: amidohydrolase [Nitrospinota bacterium]
MATRTLIRNAHILTQNDARDVYKRGSVLIEDARIARVDDRADVQESGAEIIDAEGMALLPGLVNAHSHIMCILLRGGLSADRRLMDWRLNVMAPGQAFYTPDDAAVATKLFTIEAIRSGTTTVVTNERVERPLSEAMLGALIESGMRSVFVLCFNEVGPTGKLAERAGSLTAAWPRDFPSHLKDGDSFLSEMTFLFEKYHGERNGRIHIWPGPNIPVYVKGETFRRVSGWASERNLRVSTHVSEDPMESTVGGLPVVQHLAAWGLLSPDLVAAHCIHLGDEDIRLLRESGTRVVHLPSSNLYLGSGIAPVPRMMMAGVPVALGTDNANCNDMANMFWEMRLACLLHKGVNADPAAMSAQQALDMATRNGAAALGMDDEIGVIEPGKRADLILFDLDRPHLRPLHHLPSGLVYQSQGSEVQWVWVDGEPLMEDGKLTWLSPKEEKQVLERAQTASTAVAGRAGLQMPGS